MVVNIIKRLFAIPLFIILIFTACISVIVIGIPYWIITGNDIEHSLNPLVHKTINWYWGK